MSMAYLGCRKMLIIFITCLIIGLRISLISGHHIHVCFNSSRPIGRYLGYQYQIVYTKVKDILELNCHRCDHNLTSNSTTIWSKMNLRPYGLNTTFKDFKPKKKKFKKHFRILESGALQFKKISKKDAGLYICNMTVTDEDEDEDEEVVDYVSYFVHVFSKFEIFESGSVSKWLLYQNQTVATVRVGLEEESREDQRISLNVETTNWSPCLCGTTKFDTRHFRMKHPFVRIDHDMRNSIVLHVKAPILEKLHPYLYYVAEKLTSFEEYELCLDECVPNVLQNEEEYRYSEQLFIPEGTNYKMICPDTQEDSEVLWIKEDETVFTNVATNGSESQLALDASKHFYLFNIQAGQEGKYSCVVDNFPMKEFAVTVIPKHILLTAECHEGLINVGYVLCVSLVLWILILIHKIWTQA